MMDALGLWAIHISDGLLSTTTSVGGFVFAGVLGFWGLRGVTDEEIPRIGVLTAAFFVASQIHLSVGVTTVHLLLNGLLGVILGRRAVPAIAVGLTLQSLLFAHGGQTAIGVNICVYTLPALVAGIVFRFTVRQGFMDSRAIRIITVLVAVLAWLTIAQIGAMQLFGLIVANETGSAFVPQLTRVGVVANLMVTSLAGMMAAHWRISGAFALGLLLGTATGFGTVALQACVLVYGGTQDWHALAWTVLLANLPIVVIEALGLGVVIGYLERVKPEWIGGTHPHSASGNTSSNGISH
ncbi:MAG: CbiM family transporter [Bacteroidales bacterium]|nr:CbiM family transporter [Bacteroidales bacterium]